MFVIDTEAPIDSSSEGAAHLEAPENVLGRGPYPPWIMKSGMQRCMMLPLKCSFLPDLPMPRSPVHRHLKFSAVLGTTSASNAMTILHGARAFQHSALV